MDYITDRQWGNWFYTEVIVGLTPTQSALEAHHNVSKTTCASTLRASTATVLNDTIPRILFHQDQQTTRQKLHHFCKGRFPI
ncbi:Hypothetical protein PHPALM_6221 [Phytophthora palmivora]|uniref:Transposase n=1 Tax=Phytophthora palmivora TaxID=4796 RepID=A0A2P4YFD2_9STRA|nr:Hypothetical protein PHPALM_6221 [Phytophthora palmivora]